MRLTPCCTSPPTEFYGRQSGWDWTAELWLGFCEGVTVKQFSKAPGSSATHWNFKSTNWETTIGFLLLRIRCVFHKNMTLKLWNWDWSSPHSLVTEAVHGCRDDVKGGRWLWTMWNCVVTLDYVELCGDFGLCGTVWWTLRQRGWTVIFCRAGGETSSETKIRWMSGTSTGLKVILGHPATHCHNFV